MSDTLGEFEVLVLTGVLAAGENSYGMVIHEEVEGLASRRHVSIGAVYTTLSRLEDKGFVEPRTAAGGNERGGRPRKYFSVTGAGQKALREALAPMDMVMKIAREAGV